MSPREGKKQRNRRRWRLRIPHPFSSMGFLVLGCCSTPSDPMGNLSGRGIAET